MKLKGKEKKKKKIGTTIISLYSIPVVLIIILGISSYSMASDIVMSKYEDQLFSLWMEKLL